MQKDRKTAEDRWKRQNRNMAIYVSVIVLALLGTSWVIFKPKEASQLQIASLNGNWNKLENSAHAWQKDAYLTSVSFFILKTLNPPALQVMAEFHSLQVPNDQVVQVALYADGTVVNSPRDTMSVYVSDPKFEELLASARGSAEDAIRQGDWSIDSQDALKIFAEDQKISLCLGAPQSIMTLSLNKILTEYPTWELLIAECPSYSGDFETYYLNARTGERFDPFKP